MITAALCFLTLPQVTLIQVLARVEFGYRKSDDSDANITWERGADIGDDFWTYSLNTANLDDGSYGVSVRSTDRAGNVNEMLNTRQITIDNELPEVLLIAPDRRS